MWRRSSADIRRRPGSGARILSTRRSGRRSDVTTSPFAMMWESNAFAGRAQDRWQPLLSCDMEFPRFFESAAEHLPAQPDAIDDLDGLPPDWPNPAPAPWY